MTVQQILKMKGNDILDITSISKLRNIASTLVSAANKRIRRIEKAGIVSPSVAAVENSQGIPRFSTKNKTEIELKNLITEMKRFLKSETSTVKGARTCQSNVKAGLEKQLGIKIPDNRFADFFKVFSQLRDIMPEVKLRSMKYSAMEKTAEYMIDNPTADIESILLKMRDDLQKEYERQTMDLSDMYDTGNFFDL